MDTGTTLVQSSPVTRSWLQHLRDRLPDFAYSEARYYAAFRTGRPPRVVAYLNPAKRSIRLFLPFTPHRRWSSAHLRPQLGLAVPIRLPDCWRTRPADGSWAHRSITRRERSGAQREDDAAPGAHRVGGAPVNLDRVRGGCRPFYPCERVREKSASPREMYPTLRPDLCCLCLRLRSAIRGTGCGIHPDPSRCTDRKGTEGVSPESDY